MLHEERSTEGDGMVDEICQGFQDEINFKFGGFISRILQLTVSSANLGEFISTSVRF
jgi:hypothetical protein